MKKVLFTKEIEPNILKHNLSQNIDFEVVNFLQIEIQPQEKIALQIDDSISNYLITSQNSVKAIRNLNLGGEFYVVGEKTAGLLEKYDFQVKIYKNYASELAEYILKNEDEKNWIFFCGNNRRDELFEKLIPQGHSIKEIQCYDSSPVYHNLNREFYDGVVFFSPLGVKSYLKNNMVLPETVIFTIGKTTSEEVKIHIENKIITADIPTLESVTQSINEYFYVKK